MQRAILTAPGAFTLEDAPAAPPLAPWQARVRVERAGICGTDLAIASGGYAVPLPLVLGHEWSGEVVEVGAAAHEGWLGRRVTGEINNHCAATAQAAPCALCQTHLPTHCLTRTVTGIVRADGAFQQQLVVPIGALHALPDALSWEAGAFVEPLAAALQTFVLSPISPADCVIILGVGRLGALIAAVARERGAHVIAVGRTRRQAALAARIGVEHHAEDLAARQAPADPLAPAPSSLLERVMAATQGRGADLVVEALGDAAGLAAALDVVRPRGTIALKSTPGGPAPALNTTRLVVNEVRVQGSRCGPFDAAIAWLQAHPLPLDALVEATFPLPAVEDAFVAARTARKVLLAPNTTTTRSA